MSTFPYADRVPVHRTLPEHGTPRAEVLDVLRSMASEEDRSWESGRCSGTMYCGDHDHYDFLNEAFSLFSHVNVLQRDMCPSATRFEAEVIAMTLDLLHAEAVTDTEPVGLVSSGGTGSICHALLAYRDHAAATRGVVGPNVIKPETAHPAFDKACHLFGIELRVAPVDPVTTRVDTDWVAGAVDDRTIALVGSACNYGYGTVDPIDALSDIALEHGIGLHVDGCLGGWILPFGQELGYDIPVFDFRVPGVTSISADTHKYGYALKGSSVLLYRPKTLRKYQYFMMAGWPGGNYASPGMSGSRSGGIIAATWASMVSLGREGYLRIAQDLFATGAKIKEAVRAVPELILIGEPTFNIAFRSEVVDIFHVNDYLATKGWRMNGLQRPPALHFCMTGPNTQPGVAEAFAVDLHDAVEYAKDPPQPQPRSGAAYGAGGTEVPLDRVQAGMIKYLDSVHEPA